jgi:hypothetical protein
MVRNSILEVADEVCTMMTENGIGPGVAVRTAAVLREAGNEQTMCWSAHVRYIAARVPNALGTVQVPMYDHPDVFWVYHPDGMMAAPYCEDELEAV